MTDMEIRFVGDLQRLELKPGDRFVLTVPWMISKQVAEHIREAWAKFIGDADAHPLLIMDGDAKLGVIAVNVEKL